MHNVQVRDVRVSENDLRYVVFGNEALEVALGTNRNAGRVQVCTCQRRRVSFIVDVGNLRRRESNNVDRRVAAENHVEVVEVTPRGA